MKYVRVPRSALPTLRAVHIMSRLKVSGIHPLPRPSETIGLTAWGAHWQDESVEVRWMWAVIHNTISVLDPARIETNMVLIGEDHQVTPSLLASIYLFEWIETLPWREFGIPELLDSR